MSGDLLSTLTGSNQTLNPRNIVFIEFSPYKKGKGGLTKGALLDPWGAPYQIALAPGTNALVKAGTNHIELKKRVARLDRPRPITPCALVATMGHRQPSSALRHLLGIMSRAA